MIPEPWDKGMPIVQVKVHVLTKAAKRAYDVEHMWQGASHRVLGIGKRAEHPVGDGAQPSPLGVKSLGQHVALVHQHTFRGRVVCSCDDEYRPRKVTLPMAVVTCAPGQRLPRACREWHWPGDGAETVSLLVVLPP